MKKLAMLIGIFCGLTAAAQAAEGDVEAGKEKSQVCAACHGPDGNAPSDQYPKIAGQHEGYLAKQLHDFKQAAETGGEQGRNNPIMMGQVANLSEQDIADLAAYFASQQAKPGSTPEDIIAKAEDLWRRGNPDSKIPSCTGCHGPRGDGMGLAKFPDISGQHAAYTATQLKAFRAGERANDMNGMMRGVAQKLTDEEIDLLSKYLSGLY
ncbi:c-type cytochrome [Idiomarina xiamenensis]|uniref:Cytochrome c4 n=1 Tax=Idiomarina xiamenensis 10-D-4 TaxID=740709 RepID=K2L0E3_9GAMM|nr:c-type cytochrome [Idiomarina xiamenensis]EKE83395.1 cytochrome c4 [Idiomarina xiamenensis 10-D-4]